MLEYFKPREWNIENDFAVIFIVGLYPGNIRKSCKEKLVFHGNKSGDFIEKILKNERDLYITNLCNIKITDETSDTLKYRLLDIGRKILLNDIKDANPLKILCLGKDVKHDVDIIIKKLNMNIPVIEIEHPSYILRFNKNKVKYKNKILHELK